MEASELISRLQDGRGSAPRLDIDLCEYFQLAPKEFFGSKVEKYSWENGWITTADGILHTDALKPSPLVSDLNVVFALVERKLPEWDWMWGKNSLAKKRYYVVLTKYNPTGDDPLVIDRISNIGHDDACRALLLALLAAKEPQP